MSVDSLDNSGMSALLLLLLLLRGLGTPALVLQCCKKWERNLAQPGRD